MSCDKFKFRLDDKEAVFENYIADTIGAGAATSVSGYAASYSCPASLSGPPLAACVGSIVSFLGAGIGTIVFAMKADTAYDAYEKAYNDYMKCMSKCKKK